jgi:Uma2 family endonuclease
LAENIALRKSMTLSEFLAWEERQELRWEFDGVHPFAMTGGPVAHDRITFNLQKALDVRLAGKPCQPYGPNVKIVVARSVRYPDAFVTCTRPARDATIANDPVVVFEVVSESSDRTDRIDKFREYQATASIQRYVILEQTSIAATVFARFGDLWTASALTENDMLPMPEIGIELPIAECYLGLDLSPPTEAETEAQA